MDPFICDHSFDTRYPANVNDVDLHINMTQPPSESPHRSEMLFTLARFEISYAARKLVFSPKFTADNGYPTLSLEEKNDLIESMVKDLESKYLRQCDIKIPICFFTATAIKMVLAKIKLTIHHPARNGLSGITHDRLTDLVGISVELIEDAHSLRSNDEYSQWVWLFQTYIEWDAVAFLLHTLSAVPLPSFLERAWKAVDTFFKDWDGHVPDGERRWRRLESLKVKAMAKQRSPRISPISQLGQNQNEIVPTMSLGSRPAIPPVEFAGLTSTISAGEVPVLEAGDSDATLRGATGDNVDWNFDNVPYVQGVPNWDMEIDADVFNLWL